MADHVRSYSPNPQLRRNLAPTQFPELQEEAYLPSPSPSSSSSSSSSSCPPEDLFLAGFVIVNIVGLRYYTGTISGRELVGLVREPLNPYDPNAIKVLNTRMQQVGHIERSAAEFLAPLLDSGLITIEGIVPKPPKNRTPFRLPCQIHVFTPFDSIETVRLLISEGGLQLISEADPSFALSEAVIVKEKNPKKDVRNFDQIFASVGADKIDGKKRGIVEPPRDVISSELFLHQKEGLAWLIQRENSCELPPFWEVSDDGFYVNVLTNYQTNEPPEPLQGGIFADDMGLGKTLTLLSLIVANRPGSVVPPFIDIEDDTVEHSVEKLRNDAEKVTFSDSKKSQLEKSGKSVSRIKRKIDDSGDLGPKTTLIVCPPTVLSTWIAQLDEHTRPGFLKVYLYYGERTSDVEELQKFDIVLTTYSTLSAEKNFRESPIKKIEWWRIILDEAHVIRNVAAQQSEAVIDLKGKRRWAVTGTPIQNGSFDLFSLMAFLRFQPFSIKSYWQSLVQRPLNQGSTNGLSRLQKIQEKYGSVLLAACTCSRKERVNVPPHHDSPPRYEVHDPNGSQDLPSDEESSKGTSFGVEVVDTISNFQALMGTISLRRTKDSHIGNKSLVGLPPKTVETCFVELSAEEREQYDCMESDAKFTVNEFIRADSVMRNYSTVLHIILRLRQICNCVDLCPSDIRSLIPSCNLEDVSNNPELLTKMVSILQDGDDFDCPVCLSPPTETIITCCAHIFCRSCILKTLQRLNPRCPICRHPLSKSDLYSAPPQPSDDDNPTSSSAGVVSSKVSTLLKLLMMSREENRSTKSVIFSQFRKMLIMLEEPLKAAGFVILRLDGSMPAKKRSQVIKEFGECGPGSPTVLLASLKAAGAGINLTAASRVYLLEPWWNPGVEEQAMDRVHRIGQKEEVKVVRLIVQNSIEDRILELQEKKKDLARGAFRRKGGKDLKQMRVEDLRTIMCL